MVTALLRRPFLDRSHYRFVLSFLKK